MIETQPLAHLKISAGNIEDMISYVEDRISLGQRTYCIPLNLTKYVYSKKDAKLREAINSANLVISDGVPIVWLSKRLGYKNVHRITGIDLAESIISRSKSKGWKLFFFGASPKNLEQAVLNLNKRFEGPEIVGFRDGYFKEDETCGIIDQINASKPDILFLGLGMPQKEYFIHNYSGSLNAAFCLTVGGAIDVWAGVKQRTPKMIQSLGLEWLYRSIYDKSKAINILRYSLIFLKDLALPKR